MNMKVLLALAIVAIAYGFYTHYEAEKAVHEDEAKIEETKTVEKQTTIFDTQLEAIEKAKKVEKVLQDSADRRRAEIDG